MLSVKTLNTHADVLQFIEGTLIKTNTTGTNAAWGTAFSDATTDAFVGVVVGDQISVSGSPLRHTVLSIQSVNALTLDLPVELVHAANAQWTCRRGGINVEDLQWPPYNTPTNNWVVFYNKNAP